jgi:hypothetical protein
MSACYHRYRYRIWRLITIIITAYHWTCPCQLNLVCIFTASLPKIHFHVILNTSKYSMEPTTGCELCRIQDRMWWLEPQLPILVGIRHLPLSASVYTMWHSLRIFSLTVRAAWSTELAHCRDLTCIDFVTMFPQYSPVLKLNCSYVSNL